MLTFLCSHLLYFPGEEPKRGQGDDQVDGRGGSGCQGGKWSLDHAERRGNLSGENQVNEENVRNYNYSFISQSCSG